MEAKAAPHYGADIRFLEARLSRTSQTLAGGLKQRRCNIVTYLDPLEAVVLTARFSANERDALGCLESGEESKEEWRERMSRWDRGARREGGGEEAGGKSGLERAEDTESR